MLIIGIFCAAALFAIQLLGYIEFNMAGRMLLQGSFRRLLNCQISINNFESALTLVSTPEGYWSVLNKAYKDFGFCQIEMQLAGHSYLENGAAPDAVRAWRLQIPLSGGDYVRLTREFGPNPQHNVVASFADVLRRRSNRSCRLFRLHHFLSPWPRKLTQNGGATPLPAIHGRTDSNSRPTFVRARVVGGF
jgi:UDP-GlcNAc:undecaprenyl-phosphate/decaprenyl-phosphate GlcNAc-1-phosphate transferase